MGSQAIAQNLVAEFIGTFLLVLTVGCNVLSKNAVWGGVSIACVLMVVIYCFGKVSGGCFNPAVSFACGVWRSLGSPNGMTWDDVAMYSVVQILAGVMAAGTYTALFWDHFPLGPAKADRYLAAGACELLYTFMLCFVVLNICAATYDKGGKKKEDNPNNFYGLAIGFVIVAGAYGAGAVSGGCFNPAVAAGIASGAGKDLQCVIYYTICELIGAALAAILTKMVRPEEFAAPRQGPREPGCQASSKYLSEFLGTFILVLTVGLNVLGNSKAAAFSIAASLMSMIYALGDVSGAHFNPAVTAAIFCADREDRPEPVEVAKYMVSQICGGCAAALVYSGIYRGVPGVSIGLGPNGKFGWMDVVVAEFIFTFVLCFVVLSVAVSKTTKSKEMFGLAIGSCVTVGGFAIGAISGGSLNPAVSVGVQLGSPKFPGNFLSAIYFSIIELAAGAAAAFVFNITHAADLPEKRPLTENTRSTP